MAQRTFVSKRAEVEVDGRKIVLSPLNLLQLQKLKELQSNLSTMLWVDYLSETSELIYESAKVHQPELTFEEMKSALTMDSWSFVLSELSELSGLTVPKSGENPPES